MQVRRYVNHAPIPGPLPPCAVANAQVRAIIGRLQAGK